MPFYTFKCTSCNREKEILQGMKDSPPLCEKCTTILPRNYIKMKRVFGATGKPQFKGSGFYETDYKKKGGG